MKTVFISAVYPPEREPSAVMAEEFCLYKKDRDELIEVVCPFPNRPNGTIFKGYRRRLIKEHKQKEIKVHRVWTWFIGKKRKNVNRILENITFGVMTVIALLKIRKVEIIIMETWPIFSQLAVLIYARYRRKPVVNYIKDIYPDALCSAGLIKKSGIVERCLKVIDNCICRRSKINIVISETMKEYYINNRKIDEKKFEVVNDWIDIDEINSTEKDKDWLRSIGIKERHRVFMYSGTHGYASGVDILLEVAKNLKKYDAIKIVCIGDGVLKRNMIAYKERENLDNLILLPFQERERISAVQSSSDCMLLTTSRDLGESSVPSKFITYLAVGKPVICATGDKSEISRIVKKNRIGIVVEPGSVSGMEKAIVEMFTLKEADRIKMGKDSRNTAIKTYEKNNCLKKLNAVINEMGSKSV